MSDIATYELRGPGIEVTYRRGGLTVNGDASSLQGRHFTDDQLEESDIGIGHLVTAVLVPITRYGCRIILTLLLPKTDLPEGAAGEEVTGAAVITNQNELLVVPVLQLYDVRPLTGTVSRISS
jgi:hypothetical protein